MPLEDLIAQIEEDANGEIDKIIREAKEEVRRKIREAEAKAKAEREKMRKHAERELENKKRSELSRMRIEEKKKILQKKEEIINRCFDLAIAKLRDLSSKEYIALLKPIVERNLKKVGSECEILISREEDKKIAKELKVEVGNRIEAIGGLIIKSKDGRISIDCTFDGILKRRENEIRIEIGKVLFG